jgi:serine/threonine protein kinase
MNDSRPPTGARGLTPAELADVEAIFADVADAETAARPALLAARCAGRSRIQTEVEALLVSHDRAGVFLDSLDDAVGLEAPGDRLTIGSDVGPYRLIGKIGEGGMGDVYAASRTDGLFTHRVAVKVTRASVRDREIARRFRSERQILATLQHPHIVTLLDGGATATGEAYLVMEYVDGVPLTKYCDGNGDGGNGRPLSLEARLRLVAKVCSAVQYAHQHGIVHRDLKPGNILVTADGLPKVLDFGVAKLLETSSAGEATMTRAFPGPLTPNYASPEQLRGLPITTASDVYALGVLTYEVVTGLRPYDTSGKTLDQVLDLVLNTEPARPSAAVSDARIASGDARRTLKGDLDAIVLKAMSKEPQRRYRSAGELADDLERFLAGKPVVAREPSIGYVMRRLAGRNKGAVTVAAASLVAILAALGLALWQRQVAVRAQARAEQRFRDVRQLANALIFKIHDAVTPLAGSTPVRKTIVTEALAYLERLEQESAGDESLQIELAGAYRQIGSALGDPGRPNLGDRTGAVEQYEKARRLLLPLVTRPEPSLGAMAGLVNTNTLLATALGRRTEKDDARGLALAREAVEYADRLTKVPKPHPEARALLARATFSLAGNLGHSEESIAAWQQTVALYEAELRDKPDDLNRRRNVALGEKYLGSVLDSAGKDAEAEPHYRRAMVLDEERLAQEPNNRTAQFDVAIDLANLASVLEGQDRLDEAYPLFQRSLAMRRQLSDSDPKDQLSKGRVGFATGRMARIEWKLKRFPQALALARQAVDITESVHGVTKDARSLRELGIALVVLGEIEHSMTAGRGGCASFVRARDMLATVPSDAGLTYYVRRSTEGAARCDRAP